MSNDPQRSQDGWMIPLAEELDSMKGSNTMNAQAKSDSGIGIILAQRLTGMLTGAPDTNYETMSAIVYGELGSIASMLDHADFIELPGGTTLKVSFRPTAK